MSYRDVPALGDEAVVQQRDILDRLQKLESMQWAAGPVSFGAQIVVGDVQVQVADSGGMSRDLIFTNLLTGVSSTISL